MFLHHLFPTASVSPSILAFTQSSFFYYCAASMCFSYQSGCRVFNLFNPFIAMMPLENDHKSSKFETLMPFLFLFCFCLVCLGMSKDFHQMHSIESRCVIGLENILFAGASVHFSP